MVPDRLYEAVVYVNDTEGTADTVAATAAAAATSAAHPRTIQDLSRAARDRRGLCRSELGS
ncbi:MAG: hypothetical protein Q7W05_14215 [Deltaproteobacteria bacterium]|nr:hypothetical protein [Deltaproteobacteria bacterium]